MRAGSRFARMHLPALAWAGMVALALASPGDALPRWSDEMWFGPWLDPLADKVVHFGLFAVMALLAARSFGALDPAGRGRALARRPLLAALAAAIAYGAATEMAQLWFTARTADVADFTADAAGALCAAVAAALGRRWAPGTAAAVIPRTSR